MDKETLDRLKTYGIESVARATIVRYLTDNGIIERDSPEFTIGSLVIMCDALHQDLPEKIEKEYPVFSPVQQGFVDLRIHTGYLQVFIDAFNVDGATIVPIQTGMALKYKRSNILNYNQPREKNGILIGNLYLNMVKSPKQIEDCHLPNGYEKWKRSNFIMYRNISLDRCREILTEQTVAGLLDIAKKYENRRGRAIRRMRHVIMETNKKPSI